MITIIQVTITQVIQCPQSTCPEVTWTCITMCLPNLNNRLNPRVVGVVIVVIPAQLTVAVIQCRYGKKTLEISKKCTHAV